MVDLEGRKGWSCHKWAGMGFGGGFVS